MPEASHIPAPVSGLNQLDQSLQALPETVSTGGPQGSGGYSSLSSAGAESPVLTEHLWHQNQ